MDSSEIPGEIASCKKMDVKGCEVENKNKVGSGGITFVLRYSEILTVNGTIASFL